MAQLFQAFNRKYTAALKTTVTASSTAFNVSFKVMQERLGRLVGAGSLGAVGALIQVAIEAGILKLMQARFSTAEEAVTNPIIDIGRTYARRREAIQNMEAQRARLESQLTTLNPKTKKYRELKEDISTLKARITRTRAGRSGESARTGVGGKKSSAHEGAEGEDLGTFEGRLATIRTMFTTLSQGTGSANWSVSRLPGNGVVGRYLNLPELDAIRITTSDKYEATIGNVLGEDKSPNSLWRLLEFGSGQFAKGAIRLESSSAHPGTKVKGGRGAWRVGTTIIRGHRPGNVLRTNTLAAYAQDETGLVLELAKQFERYLRTGILPRQV